MATFSEWSAPLLHPKEGKWGYYNNLTPEQKAFIKQSYKAWESGKFKDILDYKDYTNNKIKYRLRHLFDRKEVE